MREYAYTVVITSEIFHKIQIRRLIVILWLLLEPWKWHWLIQNRKYKKWHVIICRFALPKDSRALCSHSHWSEIRSLVYFTATEKEIAQILLMYACKQQCHAVMRATWFFASIFFLLFITKSAKRAKFTYHHKCKRLKPFFWLFE